MMEMCQYREFITAQLTDQREKPTEPPTGTQVSIDDTVAAIDGHYADALDAVTIIETNDVVSRDVTVHYNIIFLISHKH